VAKFVQFVEFTASPEQFEQLRKLSDEWDAARGAEVTEVTRRVLAQDRSSPGTYVLVVTFPSEEDAKANNEHPVTQQFAARLADLLGGPPKFRDLDVVEER
jgi:quinol monooxygenase YgiN